ncbi:PLAC8-like protein 1 [Merluccius polli]|uniref:PLAC8-like protein 1 n=1 Tax=Merluccius polli TaxID=89951 RepID=A0AA47NSA8_MERPO|nr:PLAC8-like protein 1 [Merluccius polli]
MEMSVLSKSTFFQKDIGYSTDIHPPNDSDLMWRTKDEITGCFGLWCCPCHACSTAKKAGECLCLPLLDSCGIIPPAAMAMRLSMRRRYQIEGTLCKDCVYATFCYACTWCQISRELNSRAMPSLFSDILSKP